MAFLIPLMVPVLIGLAVALLREFLFQVLDDLVRRADRGGDAQPFEIETREDAVDLRSLFHGGEIHAPVVFRVGNAGEEEDIGIVVVGFELVEALFGQAAEPHLDGFAGEDVLPLVWPSRMPFMT